MTSKKAEAADSAPAAKAREAYHHGDLRAGLIAAAREALEASAPEDITLKSLAVRLGVSQPAPYRHFANREALLAAVAADGFVRFRTAIAEAGASAPPNEQFLRSALAYVAFGRSNRGVYRLMFASRLLQGTEDDALAGAAKASFDDLVEGVARSAPPERVQAMAVWIWATLHGLVMLEAEGLLGEAEPDCGMPEAEAAIRQMIAVLQGGGQPR